ncbi:hypothetical protein AB0E27_42230 [Streptomyces sparsogenes]|uniref:hypothetical protein n=1 Tax=Streptomyces sparsogenes TaxID=67365 RepID=UPI0033DA4AC3
MNFWDEPGREMHDAPVPDEDFEAVWGQLELDESAGVAAVCAARLSKGDLILECVPWGGAGRPGHTREALENFARRRGISPDTADQYRRVAAWYTPARRRAIKQSGGVASYTLLREVALHTFGTADDPDARFESLLAALKESASSGAGSHLTRQAYLKFLGVIPAPPADPAVSVERVLDTVRDDAVARAAVIDAVRTDPQVVSSVLRTIAEKPGGPAEFFDHLAAEGGLEALESASFSLRKAKADTRSQEEAVFGKDEEPSQLEVILRMVLRAMKALEKPLDLDPTQVVAALPAEQFDALSRLCGSVTEWHETLLATARAADQKREEAA